MFIDIFVCVFFRRPYHLCVLVEDCKLSLFSAVSLAQDVPVRDITSSTEGQIILEQQCYLW